MHLILSSFIVGGEGETKGGERGREHYWYELHEGEENILTLASCTRNRGVKEGDT